MTRGKKRPIDLILKLIIGDREARRLDVRGIPDCRARSTRGVAEVPLGFSRRGGVAVQVPLIQGSVWGRQQDGRLAMGA